MFVTSPRSKIGCTASWLAWTFAVSTSTSSASDGRMTTMPSSSATMMWPGLTTTPPHAIGTLTSPGPSIGPMTVVMPRAKVGRPSCWISLASRTAPSATRPASPRCTNPRQPFPPPSAPLSAPRALTTSTSPIWVCSIPIFTMLNAPVGAEMVTAGPTTRLIGLKTGWMPRSMVPDRFIASERSAVWSAANPFSRAASGRDERRITLNPTGIVAPLPRWSDGALTYPTLKGDGLPRSSIAHHGRPHLARHDRRVHVRAAPPRRSSQRDPRRERKLPAHRGRARHGPAAPWTRPAPRGAVHDLPRWAPQSRSWRVTDQRATRHARPSVTSGTDASADGPSAAPVVAARHRHRSPCRARKGPVTRSPSLGHRSRRFLGSGVRDRERHGLDPRDPARVAAVVRIHRLHARSRALDSLHGHAHDRAVPRASRGHDADDAADGRR